MSGKAVDERIIRVKMDINSLKTNAPQAKSLIKGMFDNIKGMFGKSDLGQKNVKKAMDDLNGAIDKGSKQTQSALTRLKDSFGKIFGKIDTSKTTRSVEEMNKDLDRSINKSGTIIERLKTVFSKTSINGDAFKNVTREASNMADGVQKSTSGLSGVISRVIDSFSAFGRVRLRGPVDDLMQLQGSINKVDASPMAETFSGAASSISSSINIMDTALGVFTGNLMTKGLSAATAFAGNFTKGMSDGMGEYEKKMNSVQTILANTKRHGTNMGDVTAALEELNQYADQTIYNFGDMVDGIGRFTTSGINLQDSTISMKGMANAAALAGANATDLSRAIYQTSQAMSQGYFTKMDWNSINNANMNTQDLRETLIRFGKEYGTLTDDMGVNTENFANTLTDFKWLTKDVWVAAMNEMANADTELGKRASDAATKIKTFKQLTDTTREAIGSGWAQTWEAIFGNFEQAVPTWSKIGALISEVVGYTSQGRIEMFQEWNKLGGYQDLWTGIINVVEAVVGVFRSFNTAAKAVFGDSNMGVNFLLALSSGFRKLTEYIKPGTKGFGVLTEIFKIFLGVIKIVTSVLGVFIKAAMIPLKIILGIVGAALKLFVSAIELLGKAINFVLQPIVKLIDWLSKLINDGLQKVWEFIVKKFTEAFNHLSKVLSQAKKPIDNLVQAFKKMFGSVDGSKFLSILKTIGDIVGGLLKNAFLAVTGIIMSPFLAAFGAISRVAKPVIDLFGKIAKSVTELGSVFASKLGNMAKMFKLDEVFDEVKKSFEDFLKVVKGGNWADIGKGFEHLKNVVTKAFLMVKITIKEAWEELTKTEKFKQASAAIEQFTKPLVSGFNFVKNAVVGLYDSLYKAFGSKVIDQIKGFGSTLNNALFKKGIDLSGFKSFFKTFSEGFDLKQVQRNFENIKSTLSSVLSDLGTGAFENIPDRFKSVFNRIGIIFGEFKSAFTSAMQGIFKGFGTGEGFGKAFQKIFEIDFDTIKNAWTGIISWIKDVFSGKGIDTSGFGNIFKMAIDNIKSSWDAAMANLPKFDMSKIFDDLSKAFDILKDMFSNFKVGNFEAIKNQFQSLKDVFNDNFFAKAFAAIIATGFAAYAYAIYKSLRKWTGLVGSLGDLVDAFTDVAKGIGEAPKTLKNASRAFKAFTAVMVVGTILAIAHAITKIAEAIETLGKLDANQLKQGALAISVVAGALSLMTYLMSKSDVSLGTGASLLAIALAVKMLAKEIKELGEMDNTTLLKGTLVVSTLIAVMGLSVKLMGYGGGVKTGTAFAILAMVAGVKMIANEVKELGKMKPKVLAQGTKAVAIIMGAITLCVRILNVPVKGGYKSSLGNLLGLTIAVWGIGNQIAKLGKLKIGQITQGGLAVLAIIAAVTYSTMLMNMSSSFGSKSSLGNILAITIAVWGIGNQIAKLGKLKMGQIIQGGLAVVAIMGALTVCVSLMNLSSSFGSVSSFGNIIAMAAGVWLIGKSIAKLGQMDENALLQGGAAVTILMGVISALQVFMGMKIPTGGIKVAGSIIAMAAAMSLLVPPIMLLGSLPLPIIGQGVLAVASLLVALGAAMRLMSTISGSGKTALVIIAMAGALVILSGAIMMMGGLSWDQILKGLVGLGGALGILIAAGAVAGIPLVTMGLAALAVVLGSMGFVMMGAAELIKSLTQAFFILRSASEGDINAFISNLLHMLEQLAANASRMGSLAGEFVVRFISGFHERLPELLTLGLDMLVKLLEGLEQNMNRIIEAGSKLIVTFCKGVKDALPDVIPAAAELITEFLKEMLNALTENLPTLTEPLSNALTAFFGFIVDVVIQTLGPIIDKIVQSIDGFVKAIEPIIQFLEPIILSIINFFTTVVEQIAPIIDSITGLIQQLGDSITQIITGIGDTIQTIADSIVTVLQGISDSITSLFQGISDSITSLVQGIADSIKTVVDSIAQAIQGVADSIVTVLEGINSTIETVAEGISTVLDSLADTFERVGKTIEGVIESVGDVIKTIGDSIRSVLDGIAGIFDSMGNAAEDVGKAFEKIGNAISKMTKLNLGDLIGTLAAVATGIGAIVLASAGIGDAGDGMKKLADGIVKISKNSEALTTSLPPITNGLASLSVIIPIVAASIGTASTEFTKLSATLTAVMVPLTMLNPQIMMFTTTLATLGVQLMSAGLGFTTFNIGVTLLLNVMTQLSASITAVSTTLSMLNAMVMTTSMTFAMLHTAFGNVVRELISLRTELMTVGSSTKNTATSIVTLVSTLNNISRASIVARTSLMTLSSGITGVGTSAMMANMSMTMLTSMIISVVNGFSNLNSAVYTVNSNLQSINQTTSIISMGFTTLQATAQGAMAGITSSVTMAMSQSVSSMNSAMSGMTASVGIMVGNVKAQFSALNIAISTSMMTTRNVVASSMQTIVSVMRAAAPQMAAAGLQGGVQFSNGIRTGMISGIGGVTASALSIVNTASNVVRSGVGTMIWAGSMLSAGVAQGMYQGLGQVTAAANAIVAQAHRAARAAANINSPSRLFRDTVGLLLSKGVAYGIDKGAGMVVKSAKNIIGVAATAASEGIDTVRGIMDDLMSTQLDPYTPVITPIVDSSNMDKFLNQNREFNVRSRSLPSVDQFRRTRRIDENVGGNNSGSGSTENNYQVHIHVDGNKAYNERELARTMMKEMKRVQDEDDWSRGKEVKF